MLDPISKEHNANGARVLAPYFFRAYGWGYQTNDSYLVQQISSPACQACTRYVDGLESAKGQHDVLIGGRTSVQSVAPFVGKSTTASDYVFEIVVDQEAITVRFPDRTTKVAQPAITGRHALVFVSWQDGRWKVVEVTQK